MVRLRSPAPIYGSVPEWPKGADCKSVVCDFGGPNPPAPTNKKTLSQDKVFLLVGFALQNGGFGRPLIKHHGVMFLGVDFRCVRIGVKGEKITYINN